MESLVSIGLPVVKSKYLSQCIESCLNQTYNNLEIILLNNANNIGTKTEIETITKYYNDPRIRYFENSKQIPIVQNWNKVLSLAKGDFFTLLCDDDYLEPEFLEYLLKMANIYSKINIFHSRVLIVNEDGIPEKLTPLCPEIEDSLDFILHRINGWRIQFLSDFFLRTNRLKEIGGFVELPDGWGSDDITWFTIASNDDIGYCSRPLMNYRNNSENVSNSKNLKNKWTSAVVYKECLINILGEHVSDSAFSKLKERLIRDSLQKFIKNKYNDIISRYVLSNRFIPNISIPIFILLFRLHKKILDK